MDARMESILEWESEFSQFVCVSFNGTVNWLPLPIIGFPASLIVVLFEGAGQDKSGL